ncbi:MAG: hypothetical protein QNJ22_15215 [Desulfosarcinaceae bacterium]|nr:hypothetical protein [Desulfosarcinaceae bacterium]
MKKMRRVILVTLILTISAIEAAADVNEELRFTNLTYEELYVELTIFDACCTHIYDLYVWPHGTSIADFWADTLYATYSACAYGEISGDFYGCAVGGIDEYYNNVYFDISGDPYRSYPSDLPAERFVFDNPYHRHRETHRDSGSHHHAYVGCFVDSLKFR